MLHTADVLQPQIRPLNFPPWRRVARCLGHRDTLAGGLPFLLSRRRCRRWRRGCPLQRPEQLSVAVRPRGIAYRVRRLRGAVQRRNVGRITNKDHGVVLQGRLFPSRLHQQSGEMQAQRYGLRILL